MSELSHKASKCMAEGCGKEILIGKFASHKTAFCEDHASQRPKPTPPAPKAKAAVAEAGTATAAALVSPAPTEKTQPKTKPKDEAVVPVEPAPKADPKASPELRQLFTAIVGRSLRKDITKLAPAGFKLSPHDVVYYEFPSGKTLTFVELNGKCIGVAVTSAGKTEGFFDLSTVHMLKQDEQGALKVGVDLGL